MAEPIVDNRSRFEKIIAGLGKSVEAGMDAALTPKEDMTARFARLVEDVTQRDPGIDYSQEVNDPVFRAGFSRMDTQEEKTKYLNKFIGRDNWKNDRYGNYVIKPEGLKQFGIESDNPIPLDSPLSITKSDLADMAGNAPAMLGATGGALAASGYGAPTGILAAGLGAFIGKTIDELVEEQQGYNTESVPEVLGAAAKEAGMAMAGEGVARALKPIGRYAMGPHTTQPSAPQGGFGKLPPIESTVDPARRELAKEAMDMGAVPSIQQASDAAISGRMQNMIFKVLGDPLEEINRRAIRKGAIGLQRSAGGDVSRRVPFVTAKESGKGAGRVIRESITKARQSVAAAETNVTSQINKSLSAMRKTFGSADVNINEKATAIIESSKNHFFNQARGMYGAIDDLVGGKPIVSTDAMKAMARRILEESPKSGKRRVFVSPEAQSELNSIMAMDDFITLRQAQTSRTLIREAGYDPNMIKGFGKRQLGMLKSSVDDAITEAGDYIPTRTSPIVDKDGVPLQFEIDIDVDAAKQAGKLLKEADAFYKTNISKFDDIFIEKITRQSGKPGTIASEEFVEKLASIRDIGRINKIRNLVGEKAWVKVQRNYIDNLLLPYTDEGFNVNAKQAFNKINKTKNLRAFLGDKAPEIKELMREIAARNGKVNLENLNQESGIVVALKETLKRQKDLDASTRIDFFNKIDQGKISNEQIVDHLFRPGNTTIISDTKKFLGENSPEWLRIRQRSMYKILDTMVDNLSDPTKEMINGAKLMKSLEDFGYRSSVGDNPITEMFGKELAGKLNRYAKVTQLLTTKKGMSGGLVAASIALHPIKNLPKILQLKVMSKFLTSPTGVNYMIDGFKAQKTRAAADAFTKMAMQILFLSKNTESLDENK